MESKICSYTEKNARLQLVKVFTGNDRGIFEVRLNRKIIGSSSDALYARLYFHYVFNELCLNRNSNILLKMT